MGFIHGANRHAEIQFPERLDDDITTEHPVRFIDALVDPLDLTTLGLQRVTPAATGRPMTRLICCSCTFTVISIVSGRAVA
jgi:hypothetical protein